MDQNMKKMIMLEHYSNPLNKGLLDDESYVKVNMNSETCIDNLDFMYKIEDNIIKDIKFDGEACAISTSSTSIMLKLLIGKTIDEALDIIKEYENMIDEKEYNEDKLGEAIVYSDTYKQPSRKKCALLSYESIKQYLLNVKNI